jgi:hypothetical protein
MTVALPVAAFTCASATCEKVLGKSFPRAMSAEVGAPPLDRRMSPEWIRTPSITTEGAALGTSSITTS